MLAHCVPEKLVLNVPSIQRKRGLAEYPEYPSNVFRPSSHSTSVGMEAVTASAAQYTMTQRVPLISLAAFHVCVVVEVIRVGPSDSLKARLLAVTVKVVVGISFAIK